MSRNCIWSLSNLCRGNPLPHLDLLRPALPVLAKILSRASDPECLQDAAWAMSYICDGDDKRIDALIETPGVCADLVKHLAQQHHSVLTPMLRTLGNIVSGDDHHTQGREGGTEGGEDGRYICFLLKRSRLNSPSFSPFLPPSLSRHSCGRRRRTHLHAMPPEEQQEEYPQRDLLVPQVRPSLPPSPPFLSPPPTFKAIAALPPSLPPSSLQQQRRHGERAASARPDHDKRIGLDGPHSHPTPSPSLPPSFFSSTATSPRGTRSKYTP